MTIRNCLRTYFAIPRNGPQRAKDLRELVAIVNGEAEDLRRAGGAEVEFKWSQTKDGHDVLHVSIKAEL